MNIYVYGFLHQEDNSNRILIYLLLMPWFHPTFKTHRKISIVANEKIRG